MNFKTQTWLELAENDMEFAEQIIRNKQRPYYACHQCHQTIEKVIKAIIQEKSGEIPPRTHNLMTLIKLTGMSPSEGQIKFLLRLNPHYMGTKYPDDMIKFYKQYTDVYASNLFKETKEVFLWLKDCLIQKKW